MINDPACFPGKGGSMPVFSESFSKAAGRGTVLVEVHIALNSGLCYNLLDKVALLCFVAEKKESQPEKPAIKGYGP